MKRAFIEIDEGKCDGCGNCVVACAEGALEIIDGKAKVIKESFCDGLGVCMGHCPQDALKIIEKDVEAFDEAAVEVHLKETEKMKGEISKGEGLDVPCGCPGMAMRDFGGAEDHVEKDMRKDAGEISSELRQWPIQLHLVNPDAPYFEGANIVVAASCSAFSYGNFHQDFMKGKRLVIACPKLDRTEGYVEKLAEIIKRGSISSITVLRMEVPCCMGLTRMVEQAIDLSQEKVPFIERVISITGKEVN